MHDVGSCSRIMLTIGEENGVSVPCRLNAAGTMELKNVKTLDPIVAGRAVCAKYYKKKRKKCGVEEGKYRICIRIEYFRNAVLYNVVLFA